MNKRKKERILSCWFNEAGSFLHLALIKERMPSLQVADISCCAWPGSNGQPHALFLRIQHGSTAGKPRLPGEAVHLGPTWNPAVHRGTLPAGW